MKLRNILMPVLLLCAGWSLAAEVRVWKEVKPSTRNRCRLS